ILVYIKKIFIFVFIALAFAAFSEIYLPWHDKAIERAFHNKLNEKIAAGEKEIPLTDLTDFTWEHVCFFSTQYGEGGVSYPTPSEVWGRKYDGYVPGSSCDTFSHSDLFFTSQDSAQFVRLRSCSVVNLC